jgi:glucokinase
MEPWSLGVDIGGTKVALACVNAKGRILAKMKYPTRPQQSKEAIFEILIQSLKDLCAQMEGSPVSVGVGIAGQIIEKTGLLTVAPNLPSLNNFPIQQKLQEALKLPTFVLNDVKAATWGEWWHGAGKGHRDFVSLFIGTGIGGAIVSGGQMLTGQNNCAGEIGHMIIQMNGPGCTCGNRGCLEALASGWAIARQAHAAIQRAPEEGEAILKLAAGETVTAQHVVEAARKGDPLAMDLVDKAIQAIVTGSIGLVHVLNPARLIIGGGLGAALPGLLERVSEEVSRSALPAARESFGVVGAYLGEEAGVIGAADFALTHWQGRGDDVAQVGP